MCALCEGRTAAPPAWRECSTPSASYHRADLKGLRRPDPTYPRLPRAIYLIHRTSASQVLTPASRLHLYRSTDQGQHFTEIRHFNYPDRDIRDPKLVPVGNELRIYSLSRLPGFMAYDLGTDTITTVA